MHKEQELSLLQITEQYVAEVQAGRQPRLSDYLARYPRYADAIADFVAYYHAVEEAMPAAETPPHPTDAMPTTGTPPRPTDAMPTTETPPHPTDAINRVPTSRAINCHLSCDKCRCDEEREGLGGMTTLLTTASGQRLLPSQMAVELGLSVDIILLLEQRAIAPATIPRALWKQIAILLQQPSAVVQEYLCFFDQHQSRSTIQNRKQQINVAEEGTDYIASHIVNKPSFRSIVETSLQLSAEQRSRWCSILDAEEV